MQISSMIVLLTLAFFTTVTMALPPGLSPRGEPNSVITTTSNETISGGSDQVGYTQLRVLGLGTS